MGGTGGRPDARQSDGAVERCQHEQHGPHGTGFTVMGGTADDADGRQSDGAVGREPV